MKKIVLITILSLNSPIFAKDSLLYNELLLLNNPTLNSGHYKDKNLYKIDNYSIGRVFYFNNLETSLYLSYSKNSNHNKYFGLKSSIGYFKELNNTLNFGFGLSTLFLNNHKLSNLSSIYAKLDYRAKSSYNPYLQLQLQYNIFNLPKGYKKDNGFEAIINSGFDIKTLKLKTKYPLTFNPYIQAIFYDNKIKKHLTYSSIYTIGLAISYPLGKHLSKDSFFYSTRVKFAIQKTFSNKDFKGYNISIKATLFNF